MKFILAAALAASAIYAQSGQSVNLSQSQPPLAFASINYWSTNNLIYQCKAPSYIAPNQGTQGLTVSAATTASPVVFTATGHGLGDFATNAATVTPVVIISGGTGDWTAVNGIWIATPTSANAFSIPVDSSMFAAFAGQTLTVRTTSPRWNTPVWSIQRLFYDGSNNLIGTAWASNPGGAGASTVVGGTVGGVFACSSRTSYSYQ